MSNKNIKRRYHIDIELGADSFEDLIGSLKHIIFELRGYKENNIFQNEKLNHPCVSGGHCSGYHYNLYFDPEMNHNRYFKALEAGANILNQE